MNALHRRISPNKIVPVEEVLGNRIEDATSVRGQHPAERLGDPFGNIPRMQTSLFRLGIDGNDPTRFVADKIYDRVGHLALPSVDVYLAIDDGLAASLELAFPPSLIKKRYAKLPAVVGDRRGDQHFPPTNATRVCPLYRYENAGFFAFD